MRPSMNARIVRYGFIGVVAVLIILCGMKFSNMYNSTKNRSIHKYLF